MHVAADASFTWPTGQQYADAGFEEVYFYTGPALPPASVLDDWEHHGLGLLAIFEMYSERAQQPEHAAGDANYHHQRLASVGRAGLRSAWVASDGNSSDPSGALPTITQTFQIVRSVLDPLGYEPPGGYGNVPAVDAAVRGGAGWTWVPSPWGARSTDAIWQMANIASPIGGTDVDYRYLEWPGGSTPVAQHKEPSNMYIKLLKNLDGSVQAMAVDGGVKAFMYGGAPGGFGIPQEALDAHARGVEMEVSPTGAEWQEVLDRTASYKLIQQLAAGGSAGAPVDAAAVGQAVADATSAAVASAAPAIGSAAGSAASKALGG